MHPFWIIMQSLKLIDRWMKKGTKQIMFSWNVIFNENSNTSVKDTSIRGTCEYWRWKYQ